MYYLFWRYFYFYIHLFIPFVKLSTMSLGKYLVASVGGLVPMTLLNCYMGSTLRTMEDLMTDETNRLTGFFIFGGQVSDLDIMVWRASEIFSFISFWHYLTIIKCTIYFCRGKYSFIVLILDNKLKRISQLYWLKYSLIT